MSVWEPNTPDDDVYLANVIHTQIQADKVMMRERFVGSDGTINAHGAGDAEASGIHLASQVGWVLVHADAAAMVTWEAANSPLIEGSWHFDEDAAILYIVDSTLNFLQVFPVDALLLADKDDGDDHNYQEIDISKSFSGAVGLASLTVNDATGAGDTDPLDETAHAADDWETAHGAATLHSDHIANNALTGEDVCTSETASEAEIGHAANTFGWPFHLGDGALSDYFELQVSTTGFAFVEQGDVTLADGTTKCGRFKLA